MTVAAIPVQRASSTHLPQWQRFQPERTASEHPTGTHPYQRQYAHVYHQRLAVLGPRVWQAVLRDNQCENDNHNHSNNNDDAHTVRHVPRILELEEGVLSIAVGTIVKEYENSVTGNDINSDAVVPGAVNGAKDALVLEDESGRVVLATALVHQYPTGVVLGVQGTVGTDGVLHVERFYHPWTCAPPALPLYIDHTNNINNNDPTYIMLVSGLHCGSPKVSSLPRDMLLSYLQGRFGHKARHVARVIFAGGLTSTDATAVQELDGFLLALAASGVPIDVLPGEHDPTTANWPQRSLHRALLPHTTTRYGTLVARTPNPYAARHDHVVCLGTDGRNVRDLCTRVGVPVDNHDSPGAWRPVTELQALERTLAWGHVCPTGPDSVPTVPHALQDPMVIEPHLPHLYFAGNAKKFATQRVVAAHADTATAVDTDDRVAFTRLVCVPQFSETGQAVLVNLQTLDVEVVRFQDEE
jgi:DNA polymerase delta subunit 2